MAIKKIKLPDNTTEDINDPRLPAVTATDNGKVLSVSGGIWSANSKPSYTLDEVTDGSTRKLANYLPLTGGTINTLTVGSSSDPQQRPLTINAVGAGNTGYIKFTNASTVLGYLGVSAADTPAFMTVAGNAHTLLHANNYSSYALPLSAGSSKPLTGSLYINVSGNPVINLQVSGTSKVEVGYNTTSGSYLYNYVANSQIGVKDDKTPYYYDGSSFRTLWHEGNSNKSDVDWACKDLTTSGKITLPNGKAIYLIDSNGTAREVLTLTSSNFLQLGSGSASAGHPTVISGNSIYFQYGTQRNICGLIGTDGNFIIGSSTTTGGKLKIVGADGASGTRLINGVNSGGTNIFSVYNNGNVTAAGTITPGSDSRIKDNQKEIDGRDAFAIINRLKPKTWTWNEKTGNGGKKAAGLVAQDVAGVIPDAVVVGEGCGFDDFHSLNYNTIQGYEIAAIKGLIEEVKSLKAEIAELKKQIK